MASIVTFSKGLRRIEFSFSVDGPRKAVRLGRVSAKVADEWKKKIEAVVADRLVGRSHDPEVSRWLATRDEVMLRRLRAVGLADGVGLAHTTIGVFLTRYFSAMTGKNSTRIVYENVRRNLEVFFGSSRLVRDVTPADADMWRAWLKEDQKLSPATISRRIVAARTMWRAAIRWKLAAENPFVGIKMGLQSNDSRRYFVSREAIAKIMEELPDVEWKAVIALCRFGGLRNPSEVMALKWVDVDWERGRVCVTSPKTEHQEGGGSRTIPLFPELRGYLLGAFEAAAPGTVHVINRRGGARVNMRTQFEKIIRRAGLEPWPRLFHNLRASRETELMREYDLATVCKWIGNTPAVAARHYAMSTDLNDDFRRASGMEKARADKAQQNAQQSGAAGDCQASPDESGDVEKTPQNMVKVDDRQELAIAGKTGEWTILDSNQ